MRTDEDVQASEGSFYGTRGRESLVMLKYIARSLSPSSGEIMSLLREHDIPLTQRVASFFGVSPNAVSDPAHAEALSRRIGALGYEPRELLAGVFALVTTPDFIRYAPRDTVPLKGVPRDTYMGMRAAAESKTVRVLGDDHTMVKLRSTAWPKKDVMDLYNFGYAGLNAEYRKTATGRLAIWVADDCEVHIRLGCVDPVYEAEMIREAHFTG